MAADHRALPWLAERQSEMVVTEIEPQAFSAPSPAASSRT
jgi:hypothetical protein